LSLLAVSIAWLYMMRVLVPWEQYFNVEAGTMKAALGDLYSPWFGTRALLVEGKNPYGPEVTHDIQMAFYGHDVVQAHPPGVRAIDEQRFAYPVYVVFLLAPVARVGFERVQEAAPLILAFLVAISVGLWMRALRWRVPVILRSAIALFVLASPQIAQGLRLRQLGPIVGCLLALSSFLVVRNHLMPAGVMLAVCTIKPQMVVLPLAWFLLWAMGDLRKRWQLPTGFGVAVILLVAAGELALPGWPRDFLAGLAAYRKYGPVTSLLQLPLGESAGMVVAALSIAGLLAWGWVHRKDAADSAEFGIVLSAFLLGASLVLPLMPPFNQVLLILPLLILLRDWASLPRLGRLAFVVCVSWPWLASIVLLVSHVQLKSLRPIPLLPSVLVLFFPALLTLLLLARRSTIASAQNS
jgi:hypothetical protein